MLEEKIISTLKDIGVGNDFVNKTLVNYRLRPTIDQRELTLKSFCDDRTKISNEGTHRMASVKMECGQLSKEETHRMEENLC